MDFCIGIIYCILYLYFIFCNFVFNQYFECWSKVREAQALDLRDGFDDFDMLSGPPVAVAYALNISGTLVLVAPSSELIRAPSILLCFSSELKSFSMIALTLAYL